MIEFVGNGTYRLNAVVTRICIKRADGEWIDLATGESAGSETPAWAAPRTDKELRKWVADLRSRLENAKAEEVRCAIALGSADRALCEQRQRVTNLESSLNAMIANIHLPDPELTGQASNFAQWLGCFKAMSDNRTRVEQELGEARKAVAEAEKYKRSVQQDQRLALKVREQITGQLAAAEAELERATAPTLPRLIADLKVVLTTAETEERRAGAEVAEARRLLGNRREWLAVHEMLAEDTLRAVERHTQLQRDHDAISQALAAELPREVRADLQERLGEIGRKLARLGGTWFLNLNQELVESYRRAVETDRIQIADAEDRLGHAQQAHQAAQARCDELRRKVGVFEAAQQALERHRAA